MIPNIRTQRTYDSGVALQNDHVYYDRLAITTPNRYNFFATGLSQTKTLADTNLDDNSKVPQGTEFDAHQLMLTITQDNASAPTSDWYNELVRALARSVLQFNIIGYQDVGQWSPLHFLPPIAGSMKEDAANDSINFASIIGLRAIDLGELYITLSQQVKFNITLDTSASGITLVDTRIEVAMRGIRIRSL